MSLRLPRRSLLILLIAIALLSAFGFARRAAALSTPTTRGVNLPSPTVPSATVPSVSVPSVTVPGTTASTPAVSTPPVTTPAVSSPSSASGSTTHVPGLPHTPSVPSTPVSGAGSSGSGGGSRAAGSSGGGGGSSSGGGSGSGGSGSVSAVLAHSGAAVAGQRLAGTSHSQGRGRSSSAARTRESRGSRAARERTARRQARENRRLRTLVRHDFGCLGSLTGRQQRLLALRSGVDGGHAHSRAAVARILHVSRPSEARLERGALSDLVAEARQGCSQTTVTDSFVVFNASQRSAMVGWITGTPTSDTTGGTTHASTGSNANGAGADSQGGGVTRGGAHQGAHARHHSTVPATHQRWPRRRRDSRAADPAWCGGPDPGRSVLAGPGREAVEHPAGQWAIATPSDPLSGPRPEHARRYGRSGRGPEAST